MRLLEYLNNNEKLLYEASTPYTRTHPLNRKRIEFLRGTITEDNIDERKELRKDYAMIYTKLKSYLQNSDVTLKQYPDSDKSKKARYARVIAYYKLPNIDKSLAELDSLIKDEAKNPYFYELKGQILFENGRDGAVATYGIALSLRPNDPLIQVQLAQAKIEVGGKKNIEQAIIHLEQALNSNRKNPFALHQLAIAHGRSGNVGLSHLYLAEEALMLNKLDDVKTYLGLAKKNIELTPVTEIRMNDIERSLERKEK
jgi:predicted Zn-dependent protease